MKAIFYVAGDLFREASSRRWFLALGLAITLLLFVMGFTLRLDVVDGALAATRLFGRELNTDIRSVDVALRPVFQAASYIVFYGGLLFGILSCADFAPSLLSPGRIEHLLSLPVQRFELLAGTFFGVLGLSLLFTLYGAGGFTLILSVKTGVWTLRPIWSALLASVTFAAIYGLMLTSALFVRSAALSAATGFLVFIGGIIAGYRDRIETFFDPGLARSIFLGLTWMCPRISTLADMASALAAGHPVDIRALFSLLLGLWIFGLAALAFGIHRFEQKDF